MKTFKGNPTNVYSKNGHKSDSFAAHFVQHFNNTTSRTYIRKCMTFKVIKKINPIDAIKTFTKPNCNPCMQERLTILKNLCGKCVIVMNKNSEIYGACRNKTTLHQFCLNTNDPVFNGWKGDAVKGLFKYYNLKPSTVDLNTENFLKQSATKKLKLNHTLC